ncbi:CinA family nicotinamide mononucleotide deamidase-related protein [Flavobacteriaceae bacterium Ap0902]|nr:CinA family nicotinamide mononucleotide deamidase-related protein [Flavobacteriaceae bacterium Ap0902]
MKPTNAHIIAIGDEILYGQTLDTNSNFIAKQLALFNIDLIEISVIPDLENSLSKSILSSSADIIITTGGLGPTRDDKTKQIIAQLLGKKLVINAEALKWIESYYEQVTKRPMNELNRDQALAPEGSELLQNRVGTAPGIWSHWNNKIIINLPGVPYEMKHLMTEQVLPKIKERFNPTLIVHKFINVLNIPESELAIKLASFEDALPSHIKLAYLPTSKLVKLRLTSTGSNKKEIDDELQKYAHKIIHLIPDNVIINKKTNEVLESIAELLIENKLKLATAESFTSGKLAASITSIPGSSAYFKGGIIAYSPILKTRLLDVSKELIKKSGVVNEEVARQMALGALSSIDADVAISSTGVAGPDADEFGVKPGTAFIGIASKKQTKAFQFEYNHLDRYEFTEKLTQIAIQQLYLWLKENY